MQCHFQRFHFISARHLCAFYSICKLKFWRKNSSSSDAKAASIIKHIRATVGAWRHYSKATDDYDLAHRSKDKKLIAGAAKEQDRWREIHKIGLKHLDKYAAIWGAYCK